MLPRRPRSAMLALAAAAALLLPPRDARGAAEGPWYAPDHGKAQLAGWIGFVSPGLGYAWLERRLEGDLFFGWVPRAIGGEDIFSLTSKLTWRPVRLGAPDGLAVHPLSLSVQMTYTFGREYWVFEPSRYPSPDYYPLPSALRGGLGVGGDVGGRLRGRRVSLYYELVALDLLLGHWIGNRHALGIADVLSLALGVRLER